jgi:hypothetical protein
MPSNYFCSAADRRSWADMISNQTAIADFTIRDHVNAMRSNGNFPLAGLPAFLHECTHHWCFESAVGLSLALTWLRTLTDFIVWSKDDVGAQDTLHSGRSRLFRYELISSLLRPILEGLALFSEFDAYPGNSKFTSTPLMWAWILYSESGKDFQTEVQRILMASRLAPSTADRKVNVLAKAFSVSDTDGYLAGYLSVKTTSIIICEASSKFIDSDFFLAYMKEYFFEDPGLVSIILTDADDEWKWAEGVINYFHTRIKALVAEVDENTLDDFERSCSNPNRKEAKTRLDDEFVLEGEFFQSPLFKDVSATESARKQLRTMLADVLKPINKDGFEWLQNSSRALLIRRHLMCLGSYPTRVTINESHRVAIYDNEGPILGGPSEPGFEPQEGDGVLDFYVSPGRFFRVYAVSLGASLVLLHPVSEPDEVAERQLSISLLSSEVVRRVIDAARTFLDKNEFRDPQHLSLRIVFSGAVQELYETWSTVIVKRDSLATTKNALRADGLWTITGGSLERLRALASIGLCQSVGWSEENTAQLLKERGIDYAAMLKSLSRSASEWGVSLFKENLAMI